MKLTSLRRPISFVLASTLAVACAATQNSEPDGASGDAMTAAWFAANLPHGSDIERAVLALANDRSMSTEEYVSVCNFTRAVSASITDYRQGDEPADISDDEMFDDLAELDRVPFTNSTFWVAAAACARAHYMPTTPGGVCATGTSRVQQSPVYLEFVLDGSGSMDGPKWQAATQALASIFAQAATANDANVGMGLIGFSDTLDRTSAAGPYPTAADVPIRRVDAGQLAAFTTRLAGMPQGATPLIAALRGAYKTTNAFVPAFGLNPGGSNVVVLLTDGTVTDGAPDALIALVRGTAGSPQTFAIGVGPFGTSDVDSPTLGQLAELGGTRSSSTCNPTEAVDVSKACYLHVTPGAKTADQIRDELLASIGKIRSDVAACDIGLQSTGLGPIDLARVDVTYTDAAGVIHTVPRDAVDGFSLDDLAHPTKVLLRGNACAALRATSSAGGSVRVTIGCGSGDGGTTLGDASTTPTTGDDGGTTTTPSAPNPGDACTTAGKLFERGCGLCGTQQAVCEASLSVSAYGACLSEVAGGCVPGTAETVACGMCGTASRVCAKDCRWNTDVCRGEPAGACAPGTMQYVTAGCTAADTYRKQTCTEACTFGPPAPLPCAPKDTWVVAGPSGVTTTFDGTLVDMLPRLEPSTTCPARVGTTATPSAYTEVRNPFTHDIRVEIRYDASSLDTVTAAYVGAKPDPTSAARAACASGVNDLCPESGSSQISCLVGAQAVTIPAGGSAFVYTASYYAAPMTSPAFRIRVTTL